MTKKELSQLCFLKEEIASQKEQIKALEAAATQCTQHLTGMPGSQSYSDKVGKIAAELADLRSLLELNHQKRFYELSRLQRFICDIEDSFMRQAFQLRFIENLQWDEVARRMPGDYSEDSVRKAVDRYIEKTQKSSAMSA